MIDVIAEYVFQPIKENPVGWMTTSAVIATLVWIAVSYLKKNRIENLESQLKLARDRLEDYQAKLDGATPSEAAEKMYELEQKVSNLAKSFEENLPKKLSRLQAETLTKFLAVAPAKISLCRDGASSEATTIARGLERVFLEAGWEVSCPLVLGVSNPPISGIRISYIEGAFSNAEKNALESAFEAANLAFERAENGKHLGSDRAPVAEILITAPLSSNHN
ncbi:hypothetical protein AXZ77_0987 [Thioclava sp. ES.031]|uniref:hypothetical protein n=1 Tax=Thioclava sp. ES.031 TaxID=1798203 RepID=UPI000C014C87|nr:hypothetical protein [Thioclava sp. ES.031]PFG62408.1 hypothetical protein AXZ77_0987 [Thioclava sp. ES.031]